jgi:hypothetical protein
MIVLDALEYIVTRLESQKIVGMMYLHGLPKLYQTLSRSLRLGLGLNSESDLN